MNFDYTYIVLFGAIIFEPMTILTNFFIGFFCLYALMKLHAPHHLLNRSWSLFFLFIGISSTLGSLAHGAHFQLGDTFFKASVFAMNAVSLFAIYYCYLAAALEYNNGDRKVNSWIRYGVIGWIFALLVISFLQGNFILLKIHAGIVLSYSLLVHTITFRRGRTGSKWIAAGIIVSFLSILTHSLKLSIHEWFNYKDISHIIMLLSLIFLYRGVQLNSTSLQEAR